MNPNPANKLPVCDCCKQEPCCCKGNCSCCQK
jgi:hypothetical protein